MLSDSQLSRLSNQLDSLEEVIKRVPSDKLDDRILTDKWSIKENIAHLLRYQEELISRINLILRQKEPVLKRYVAEDDELFPPLFSKSLQKIMDELQKSRQSFNGLVTSIPEDKLSRTGIHPVLGKMTLTEWIEFFLLHEAHHLMTIFKLAHS